MKFNDEPFPIDLDAPKSVPCSGERCPLQYNPDHPASECKAPANGCEWYTPINFMTGDNSWIAMLLMLAILSGGEHD